MEDEYQIVYRFDNTEHTWVSSEPPDPNSNRKLAEMIGAGVVFTASFVLLYLILTRTSL